MLRQDGLELLKLLKSLDSLKDIPVIMMSSDGEMEIVATCMEIVAADYLIKPIRYWLYAGYRTLRSWRSTSTCRR